MSIHRKRVAVVRGGPSAEYSVSLKTGESVLRHLDREKYQPHDVVLTRDGVWYINGVRTTFADVAQHSDVIFNAMHGEFGEDGKAQQLFQSFGIPYTGSDALASAIGMHKGLAKERFVQAGLKVARGEVVPRDAAMPGVAYHLGQDMGFPLIVKPVTGGSSVATRIARNETDLVIALDAAAKYGDVLVEEFIEGKEGTCAVVDTGDGEHFVLYPIEIRPHASKEIFDFDAKYDGSSEEICPGNFTIAMMSQMRDAASTAHRAIGARHYSRSDFIVTPTDVYILEINTLPGLTESSLLPKALEASNVTMSEFLEHVIELALRGK
jgi:D-alanine-D-alanine ligase